MKTNKACPECGTALANSNRCTCGWFHVEQSNVNLTDHRCAYVIATRRCPLPGTICSFPYAKGPWYCSEHKDVLHDPRLGEAVLLDAEKNYHEILESRKDWRKKLFEKKGVEHDR